MNTPKLFVGAIFVTGIFILGVYALINNENLWSILYFGLTSILSGGFFLDIIQDEEMELK